VKWYRLSADKGQPFAQNNLGVMYKNGWGIKQDYVEAYFWFSLAVTYYFDFEEMNLERAAESAVVPYRDVISGARSGCVKKT